jgi:hypothetical protein
VPLTIAWFALQPVKHFIGGHGRPRIVDRLLPDLAQFLNALLPKQALVVPVTQRVPDDFAAGRVLTCIHGLPNDGGHLGGGQRDADLFDGGAHGSELSGVIAHGGKNSYRATGPAAVAQTTLKRGHDA